MIVERIGNIFDTHCDAITNTVNCVGVMGAGLARQFKERFPDYYQWYQDLCAKHELAIGRPALYGDVSLPYKIISLPTKRHWKERSELNRVESSLKGMQKLMHKRGIYSAAMVRPGCGLGGLDWKDVEPIVNEVFSAIHFHIEIWIPPLKR